MIRPTSRFLNLKIEGSHENEAEGEIVIDVSEYSQAEGRKNDISYFQGKKESFADFDEVMKKIGRKKVPDWDKI